MKRKKVMFYLCSVCLVGAIFAGCKWNSKQQSQKAQAEQTAAKEQETFGRYVEEDISMPTQNARFMVKNAEGALELYELCGGEKGDYCKRYVQKKDGSWDQKKVTWCENDNVIMQALAYAPDGTAYAVVEELGEKIYLVKRVDDETGEKVSLPELEQTDVRGYRGIDKHSNIKEFEGPYLPGCIQMEFLENGNLVLTAKTDVRVYDLETGTCVEKLNVSAENLINIPIAVNGNKIVLPTEKEDGYRVWDVEKKEEIGECKWSGNIHQTIPALDKDGSIFIVSKKGISHMQPGGSIEEQLIQADQMMIGDPNSDVIDWCLGDDHSCYILYDYETNSDLKQYFFNETVKKAVHHLQVYSLSKNEDVRQAVNFYNRRHQDVEITYTVGSDEKKDTDGITQMQQIKQSGADILVLDGCSVEELEEQDTLLDMRKIFEKELKDGTLQENIAAWYQKNDGSIYAMPIRYGVPLLCAQKEYQKAFATLDSLEKWLKKHPDRSLLDGGCYKEIDRLLLQLYSDEIFDENRGIRLEKCKQYLSVGKEIGARAKAEIDDQIYEERRAAASISYLSDWTGGNLEKAKKGEGAAFTEVDCTWDLFGVHPDRQEFVTTVKNLFVPRGVIGISAKTLEKEVAEDFVSYLFTDSIQKRKNNGYGLPMNQKAEQNMVDETAETNSNKDKESADEPVRAQVKAVFTLADQLKEPQRCESELMDVIYFESEAYYAGKQELEETAEKIVKNVTEWQKNKD
ncbi:MAG: hypothetical protein ACI4HI_07955 [Lachnospiraceae bacterium]